MTTWLLMLGAAQAQTPVLVALPPFEAAPLDSDLFHPSLDARYFLGVDDAHVWNERGVRAQAAFYVVGAPYQYTDLVTGEQLGVVDRATALNLAVAGWRGPVRLGIDAPLYLASTGADQPSGGAGIGDVRASARYVVRPGRADTFGGALHAALGFPTGSPKQQLTSPGPSAELGAILDYATGSTIGAINAGFRVIPTSQVDADLRWDDQLYFKTALAWMLTPTFSLGGELSAYTLLRDPLEYGLGNPVELTATAQYAFNDLVQGRLFAGTGLSDAVGAPSYRVGFAVVADGGDRMSDADGDGVRGEADECPSSPEDLDGHQDGDGCPDTDNDGDGILDVDDSCPNEIEDIDLYEDEDGCPEGNARVDVDVVDWAGRSVSAELIVFVPAVGGDPIAQFEHQSSLTVELPSGEFDVEVWQGGLSPYGATLSVPEAGVVIHTAVMEPKGPKGELRVAVLSDEGPIQGRVVLAPDGKAQSAPGPFKVPVGELEIQVRADGYRSATVPVKITAFKETATEVRLDKARASVEAESIQILDKVYFYSGTSRIRPESLAILGETAQLLKENPQITRLRVEGHTDSQGGDADNLRLSQRRAEAVVRYLVKQGVAAERLVAKGFGEQTPIDDNATAEGRAGNRRVEFVVEQRD